MILVENLKKKVEEWLPETPEFVRGFVITGNRSFASMIMQWENLTGPGNLMVTIYNDEGDPKGVYDITKKDVERCVKILIHMYETFNNPDNKPIKSIEIRKEKS